MKKMIVTMQMILLSAYLLMIPLYTFAQSADGGNDPAVSGIPRGHMHSFYGGPMPYIILGAVMVLLAYIGYRYYADHSVDLDSDINTYD